MPKGKRVIDFSKAVVLEALPVPGPYLAAISEWKYGQSGSGGEKVHVVATVLKPDQFKNRKLFDDINTENENTLGRLMLLLEATGEVREAMMKPGYNPPEEEDMLGRQFTVFVGLRESDMYGDRNTMKRVKPVSVFEALGQE